MKKILSILLLCSLLLVWGCSKTCTCTTNKQVVSSGTENPNDPNNPNNPDDPNNPTHTNTELLCNPRGWVLSAATSAPAYLMPDGSYVTNLMTEGEVCLIP